MKRRDANSFVIGATDDCPARRSVLGYLKAVCFTFVFASVVFAEDRSKLIPELKELEWMIGKYRDTKSDYDEAKVTKLSIEASDDGRKLLVKYDLVFAEHCTENYTKFNVTEEIYWDQKKKLITSTYEIKHFRSPQAHRESTGKGSYRIMKHPTEKNKWQCLGKFLNNEESEDPVDFELSKPDRHPLSARWCSGELIALHNNRYRDNRWRDVLLEKAKKTK